jgi:PAS domain S-box-containing protein
MTIAWGPLHAGLQSVLDTALDAVVVMDCDDRIVGWNRYAETLFGWSEEEALGKQLSLLIVPQEHRAGHAAGLRHYLDTGVGPVLDKRIEVPALHREGHQFPIELSVTCSDQFGGTLFVGFLRDLTSQHAIAERQQRQLRESDHRVKNMLTVVSALAQQTARVSANLDDFSAAFGGRLEALARSHQLLVGTEWNEVALTALADQVLGADVAQGRARFGGPELLLKPAQVLGLSMILHELYTNAVKYGALCSEAGDIALDWSVSDGQVEMCWHERGPPCSPDVPSSGFGQRMIAMSVRSDLGGTIERDWRSDGLTALLRFPVDRG